MSHGPFHPPLLHLLKLWPWRVYTVQSTRKRGGYETTSKKRGRKVNSIFAESSSLFWGGGRQPYINEEEGRKEGKKETAAKGINSHIPSSSPPLRLFPRCIFCLQGKRKRETRHKKIGETRTRRKSKSRFLQSGETRKRGGKGERETSIKRKKKKALEGHRKKKKRKQSRSEFGLFPLSSFFGHQKAVGFGGRRGVEGLS